MLSDWKSFWSWTFGFGFQSDHIHWLLSRLLHVCSSFKYPGWVEKVELFRVGQKLLTAPCDRSGNFIHLTDRRGYEVELKFPCMPIQKKATLKQTTNSYLLQTAKKVLEKPRGAKHAYSARRSFTVCSKECTAE